MEGLLQASSAAYTESRYVGRVSDIAVRRGNDTLRLAFNWALFRLWEKGSFTHRWLRYSRSAGSLRPRVAEICGADAGDMAFPRW